ncbi:WxL domain-containing protein [Levilactobacillus cerevisiae]|uniref:WxL domain-containing protein n=1 Tax=Levilactobacillus cerevisiae TaxID=1704076 RepID=UPI00345EEFF6
MKKTLSTIVLASALLLGTVAPIAAHADGLSGSTNGSVTFTKPADQTTPVDPNNPDTPSVTPGDNGGTTPSGPLTFLYVTKTLDFGTHETSTTGAQTFTAGTNAATDSKPGSISTTTFSGMTANPNFVTEVSDTRASNAGWEVDMSATNFTDGTHNLTGASLNFNTDQNATVKNSATTDTTGISQPKASAKLGTTTAVPVYTAAKGSGAGTTSFQVDPNNISLSAIPANVTVTGDSTTYSGTLNWTLAALPES